MSLHTQPSQLGAIPSSPISSPKWSNRLSTGNRSATQWSSSVGMCVRCHAVQSAWKEILRCLSSDDQSADPVACTDFRPGHIEHTLPGQSCWQSARSRLLRQTLCCKRECPISGSHSLAQLDCRPCLVSVLLLIPLPWIPLSVMRSRC